MTTTHLSIRSTPCPSLDLRKYQIYQGAYIQTVEICLEQNAARAQVFVWIACEIFNKHKNWQLWWNTVTLLLIYRKHEIVVTSLEKTCSSMEVIAEIGLIILYMLHVLVFSFLFFSLSKQQNMHSWFLCKRNQHFW